MDEPEGLALTDYRAEEVLLPGKQGEPHPGVRITVHGEWFPFRALEPQLLIDEEPAEMVQIARDQRSIVGYLYDVPREGARIAVHYDPVQRAELEARFSRERLAPLPKGC